MQQDTYIFAEIHEAIKDKQRPLVVGISGAYTSGKTTFTKKFSQYLTELGLRTQIIHYDDFHNPLRSISWEQDNQDSEVDVFYNRSFNTQKLIADVLTPLVTKGTINKTIKGLNWGTGLYDQDIQIEINEQTIVLLEGALLFRPVLMPYLTYKVFLDIDEREILNRGEIRDVPKMGIAILDKYKERYLPVHRRYLAEDNPQNKADIIIDNNEYHLPKVVN